ncbi:MAG: hypothetical protein ACOC8B_01940 [Gemmatimonadota bacterium]
MQPVIENAFHEAQEIFDSTAVGLDIVSELEIVDATAFPKASEYVEYPFPLPDFEEEIGRRKGRINSSTSTSTTGRPSVGRTGSAPSTCETVRAGSTTPTSRGARR